jgi:hypothetical protein
MGKERIWAQFLHGLPRELWPAEERIRALAGDDQGMDELLTAHLGAVLDANVLELRDFRAAHPRLARRERRWRLAQDFGELADEDFDESLDEDQGPDGPSPRDEDEEAEFEWYLAEISKRRQAITTVRWKLRDLDLLTGRLQPRKDDDQPAGG